MSRNTYNDVPPEILDNEEDDSAVSLESGSDVEFDLEAHSSRIARMIGETTSMEFVTTATETEALLLEANLIKQLKPRYNVLMRDDKSLPYILLTGDHEAPQLVKHRGARTRKGDYYGPFATVWAVNRTVNALQRAFLLRSCNDSYYENRTRPC